MTLVHMVRINKQEASLAACPEKCLDLSFLNFYGTSVNIPEDSMAA